MNKKISDKLSDKLSDKFGGVFSREKPREEPRPEKAYFNETYFDVKLAYHPHKLSLMKVDASISVGPDAGMPMMVNCKWLVKKGNQVSEIQGVRSSCYQPCIEDVGCAICVQIQPLIEGKIYSGATIIKETAPLELGATLETQFTNLKNKLYHFGDPVSFEVKIENILGSESQKLSIQCPLDAKIIICKKDHMDFDVTVASDNGFNTQFWITKEYPQIEFIRKSYNGIVITFSESTSMRLAFKENTERQILGLLMRTLTANSSLDWPIKGEVETTQKIEEQIKQLQCSDFSQKKQKETSEVLVLQNEERHEQNVKIQSEQDVSNKMAPNLNQQTEKIQSKPENIGNRQTQAKLQMKIGILNSELNKVKSQYKQLLKNYQIEKLTKIKLQAENNDQKKLLEQMSALKNQKQKINEKLLKMGEDNRFYKNQIALIKKTAKENNQKLLKLEEQNKTLSAKLKKQETDVEQLRNSERVTGSQMGSKLSQATLLNTELSEQNQSLKGDIEHLQNQLKAAHRKINSLCQQKTMNVSPVKSQSYIPIGDDSKQLAQKSQTIKNLEFKLSNLQMLLKFKSGQRGSQVIGLQKIINSLTEAITDKDEQLAQLKRVNKELLRKIHGK